MHDPCDSCSVCKGKDQTCMILTFEGQFEYRAKGKCPFRDILGFKTPTISDLFPEMNNV